jgi:hypothetical protein
VLRWAAWVGAGLLAGLMAGFGLGLARRRPTPETVVYVPPRPSEDHRAVGPHVTRLRPYDQP